MSEASLRPAEEAVMLAIRWAIYAMPTEQMSSKDLVTHTAERAALIALRKGRPPAPAPDYRIECTKVEWEEFNRWLDAGRLPPGASPGTAESEGAAAAQPEPDAFLFHYRQTGGGRRYTVASLPEQTDWAHPPAEKGFEYLGKSPLWGTPPGAMTEEISRALTSYQNLAFRYAITPTTANEKLLLQARAEVEARIEEAATAQVPAAEPLCMCKDRPAAKCPGEWEPGCDLGANERFARVGRTNAAKGRG